MKTTAPHFVQLCQLLVHQMEQVPQDHRQSRREEILDGLMADLMQEGLVFDREFAGRLFDQLEEEPVDVTVTESRVRDLRDKIQRDSYFTSKVLETLGDRILWVMGTS